MLRRVDHRRTEHIGGAATPTNEGGAFSVAKQSPVLDLRSEVGQTMAEYAVILTMITLAIFAALLLLNTGVSSRIGQVANLIP